jgi:hypothetical protein
MRPGQRRPGHRRAVIRHHPCLADSRRAPRPVGGGRLSRVLTRISSQHHPDFMRTLTAQTGNGPTDKLVHRNDSSPALTNDACTHHRLAVDDELNRRTYERNRQGYTAGRAEINRLIVRIPLNDKSGETGNPGRATVSPQTPSIGVLRRGLKRPCAYLHCPFCPPLAIFYVGRDADPLAGIATEPAPGLPGAGSRF